MTKKFWWGAFVVVLGAGASVAASRAAVGPIFQKTVSFEIMVCSGLNCAQDSVKEYEAVGKQVVNLTSGLTQDVSIPALPAGADVTGYSCFYKDNLEMLVGTGANPGFGSISISPAPDERLYVSSKSRGGNLHMPVAIQVIYARPRLDPAQLLSPKACERP